MGNQAFELGLYNFACMPLGVCHVWQLDALEGPDSPSACKDQKDVSGQELCMTAAQSYEFLLCFSLPLSDDIFSAT